MTERIPVYGPLLDDDDIDAVASALKAGWLGMGRDVEAFEQGVLSAIGAPDLHAVGVSTGFAALHVGMLIAGVGPGDEVIVPSLTHLADIQCVLATGAEPVFCDIDDETLCIDPVQIEALLSDRTKAIIAMDYGCNLCDHDAIGTIAGEHGLRVIHDAAHAFGSERAPGEAVGTFSDICMFSFDPVKSLTAIDAGVLVLRNRADERMARELRLLGSDQPAEVMYQNARTWDYDAVRVGFRYHLTNIHAALGVAQLAKLDRIRVGRQRACRRYQANLAGIDGVRQPDVDVDGLNPFMFFIRVAAEHRDPLRAHLAAEGIDTGLHWRPAHHHTLFRAFRQGPLSVTERAAAELITLPLHSDMPDSIVDRVTDSIADYFR